MNWTDVLFPSVATDYACGFAGLIVVCSFVRLRWMLFLLRRLLTLFDEERDKATAAWKERQNSKDNDSSSDTTTMTLKRRGDETYDEFLVRMEMRRLEDARGSRISAAYFNKYEWSLCQHPVTFETDLSFLRRLPDVFSAQFARSTNYYEILLRSFLCLLMDVVNLCQLVLILCGLLLVPSFVSRCVAFSQVVFRHFRSAHTNSVIVRFVRSWTLTRLYFSKELHTEFQRISSDPRRTSGTSLDKSDPVIDYENDVKNAHGRLMWEQDLNVHSASSSSAVAAMRASSFSSKSHYQPCICCECPWSLTLYRLLLDRHAGDTLQHLHHLWFIPLKIIGMCFWPVSWYISNRVASKQKKKKTEKDKDKESNSDTTLTVAEKEEEPEAVTESRLFRIVVWLNEIAKSRLNFWGGASPFFIALSFCWSTCNNNSSSVRCIGNLHAYHSYSKRNRSECSGLEWRLVPYFFIQHMQRLTTTDFRLVIMFVVTLGSPLWQSKAGDRHLPHLVWSFLEFSGLSPMDIIAQKLIPFFSQSWFRS